MERMIDTRRPSSPFDDGAAERLRRMGLLQERGKPDRESMAVLCCVYTENCHIRRLLSHGLKSVDFGEKHRRPAVRVFHMGKHPHPSACGGLEGKIGGFRTQIDTFLKGV